MKENEKQNLVSETALLTTLLTILIKCEESMTKPPFLVKKMKKEGHGRLLPIMCIIICNRRGLIALKMIFRFLRELLLVALVATGVGAASYYGYQWYEERQLLQSRPPLKLAVNQTSISPAWQTYINYQKQLRRLYPFINKVSNYVPPRTWDGKDFVVPGLRTTAAYNLKTRRFERTSQMTPQGVTIADKYLLITAYDAKHRHNSVIYVLDKRTGRYLKTLQLPGRPHLGGITYDAKGHNIWVTGSFGHASALMSLSLKTIEQYHLGQRTLITYNHQIVIPSIERASAVTCYDDQLFVGFFNLQRRGKAAAYTIARRGKYRNTITNKEVKSVSGTLAWSDPNGSTSMDKQIQGIAIYQNQIFLSQSYGSQSSKLYVFPITALNSLDERNAELVVEMPPYLEQITAYRGQLICVFESGAKQYARPHMMVMDRTLSVNINALFGS